MSHIHAIYPSSRHLFSLLTTLHTHIHAHRHWNKPPSSFHQPVAVSTHTWPYQTRVVPAISTPYLAYPSPYCFSTPQYPLKHIPLLHFKYQSYQPSFKSTHHCTSGIISWLSPISHHRSGAYIVDFYFYFFFCRPNPFKRSRGLCRRGSRSGFPLASAPKVASLR